MQVPRVRNTLDDAAAIFQFYGSIVGDAPYPSFTLAMTESDRPGGHSPPYFAVVNSCCRLAVRLAQRSGELRELSRVLPRPRARASVVGPGGRLEELSRAVDQRRVRAVLRGALRREDARRRHVRGILRQMRRLGDRAFVRRAGVSRLPPRHIRGEDRIFRALVYNKGAMVLHMLRRLVGDDAFFAGSAASTPMALPEGGHRRFPAGDGEKRRAGTFPRFFETWVMARRSRGSSSGYQLHQSTARGCASSSAARPVDIPLMVTIAYLSGET